MSSAQTVHALLFHPSIIFASIVCYAFLKNCPPMNGMCKSEDKNTHHKANNTVVTRRAVNEKRSFIFPLKIYWFSICFFATLTPVGPVPFCVACPGTPVHDALSTYLPPTVTARWSSLALHSCCELWTSRCQNNKESSTWMSSLAVGWWLRAFCWNPKRTWYFIPFDRSSSISVRTVCLLVD